MIIFIPATRYTATVQGSVVKSVRCENCGHDYAYTMRRVVSGSEKVLFSSSRGNEKALKKARANLARALESEHDEVPCPMCHWHQAAHIDFVRRQSYPQLKSLAGAFFIFAGLALGLIVCFLTLTVLVLPEHRLPKPAAMFVFVAVPIVIASPGLLLRGLRSLLALSYRPNGSVPAAPSVRNGTPMTP